MNKKFKSILTMALSLVLVVVMLAGCKPKDPNKPDNPITPATLKQAEYNTTTQTMPSNWNELTYSDNNDTQIIDRKSVV